MSSKTADPLAMIRTRRNMQAGRTAMGTSGDDACVFVIVIRRRTVPPSSHPAWSARLKRTRRTPLGFQEDAEDGEKVVALRPVM